MPVPVDGPVDVNRQALLVLVVTVLGPAAVWHARRPGALATTIRSQGVLPGASGRSGAAAWSGTVVVGEAVVLVAAVAALASSPSSARPAGLLAAAAGAAFAAYVGLLLARGYGGDCGCSPVSAAVSRLSVVPGAALLAAGTVLAADPSLDGVALDAGAGGLEHAVALAAAALVGGLVALLPASALVGDPLRLGAGG